MGNPLRRRFEEEGEEEEHTWHVQVEDGCPNQHDDDDDVAHQEETEEHQEESARSAPRM